MSVNAENRTSGPVKETARIPGIDVARGFALLGILFVNAAFFSMPFGEMYTTDEPVVEGWMSRLVYWFTGVFCTGKFYPLFSILFGAGLAILYEASIKTGRSFGWIFFRRLVVLATFGILHIVLLWYGDILLLYSFVGLAMLLLGRASPRTLLLIATVVFCISIIASLGFASLTLLGGLDSSTDTTELGVPVTREMPEGASPFEKVIKVLMDWNPNEEFDSRIVKLEREIQAEGPFSNAILLRLLLYAFSLVFYMLVTIWIVLSCFCIGAALAKSGFFYDSKSVWRKRLMVLGAALGLPISIFANFCSMYADGFIWMLLYLVGSNISGILLALAYLSGILSLVERNPSHPIAIALSRLGRMGLTGYLLESTMMSALMSHWGMAWFGTTTWSQRAGIVVVIYLCILAFANFWMSRFQYGPIEWLWRSLTYLKWQSIRRR